LLYLFLSGKNPLQNLEEYNYVCVSLFKGFITEQNLLTSILFLNLTVWLVCFFHKSHWTNFFIAHAVSQY